MSKFINTYPGYSAHEANVKEADARLFAEAMWAEYDRREEEARERRRYQKWLRETYTQRCDQAVRDGLRLDRQRDEAILNMPLLPRTKDEATVAADALAKTKEIPKEWQFRKTVPVSYDLGIIPVYAGKRNAEWYVNLITALIQGNDEMTEYYTKLLTREWVWYYTKNPKIDIFNSNVKMPEE